MTLHRRQRPDGARYTSVDAVSHSGKAEHSDLGGSGPCLHGLSDSISGQGWQGDYYIKNDLRVSLSRAPARHDLEADLADMSVEQQIKNKLQQGKKY